VPASADYVAAVALGLGWGMVPDLQAGAVAGQLTELDEGGGIDVLLHWQQWRLRSESLDRVRNAVLAAAGRELDPSD
jgi:LysR family transcriptional regulator (chromosome initiation inhibitor)